MNETRVNAPPYRSLPAPLAPSLAGLVLGTAGLAGVWGPVNKTESVDTLLRALEEGVAALDTAPAYSDAEELVGLALRQWRGARPSVSTKVGKLRSDKPDEARYDFSPEALRTSVYASLDRLGLDRLDVLFMHDPVGLTPAEVEPALATLSALRDEGVVGLPGIGGNYPDSFQEFITPDMFQIFMGYNRFNAVCQEAFFEEFPVLRTLGIEIWQASPLFMGLLGSQFETYQRAAPDWIPAPFVRRAEGLRQLGEAHGLTLPELALRYLRSTAVVDRIVIGAANRAELLGSLHAWRRGSLPQPLFEAIHQLQFHD